jgi:hypothetical protein
MTYHLLYSIWIYALMGRAFIFSMEHVENLGYHYYTTDALEGQLYGQQRVSLSPLITSLQVRMSCI